MTQTSRSTIRQFEATVLRHSRLFIVVLALFPLCVSATWYSIGTLGDWKPKIQNALHLIEVEYDDGAESMSEEDRIGAIYLIAYLEGIRDGSLYNGALAYSNKYGEDAKFDPENEVDVGFCLEDPYFEIVPKLEAHIAQKKYTDEMEFMDVLMNFLRSEYPCQ